MKQETETLCLISIFSLISFIAGVVVGPLAILYLLPILPPNVHQRKQESKISFYRTMHAIFEDTYDPNDGLVFPEVFKTIQECKDRLGNKCELFFIDISDNYNECVAFFPSGDYSYVSLRRKGKNEWIIHSFYPLDWDRKWSETLYRIGKR